MLDIFEVFIQIGMFITLLGTIFVAIVLLGTIISFVNKKIKRIEKEKNYGNRR